MKKIITLIGLTLVLGSCQKNSDAVPELTGKWKEVGGSDEISFVSGEILEVKSQEKVQNGGYFYKIEGNQLRAGWMLSCVAADFTYSFTYNSKKNTFTVGNFYNREGSAKITFQKSK